MSADERKPVPPTEAGEREPSDELADQVAEAMEASPEQSAEGEAGAVAEEAEEVLLEEEKVKDEIDIQIDLLQDPDWTVRREAVITLGEMGDERCVEPLVKALYDGDWQVREAAMEALAQVGSPAVEQLIKHLRSWDVRKFVLRTLGRIKDERVLEPVIGQLRSDEFGDDAVDALADMGKPAVERLVEALKDKEEVVRKRAVSALGRIQDPSAVDGLVELLKDPDWYIRLTAAAALERISDDRGRDAIKPLLKDPDLVVRMRAERILAAWKKKQPTNA